MAFIKDRIIYERGKIKVYINECHAKGKKTRIFAIRKDDKTGLADLLGIIKWSVLGGNILLFHTLLLIGVQVV